MKEVLISAQSFGYGPAAKATAIATGIRKKIPNVRLTFLGFGTAKSFVSMNKDIFDEIIDAKKIKDIGKFFDRNNFGQIVAVMEPYSSVFGRQRGIQVSYVDSLFFFWNWEKKNSQNDISDLKAISRYSDEQALLKIMSKLDPHERQLMGHLAAERSFVQKFPGLERQDISASQIGNIFPVGPIVEDFEKTIERKDTLLISLCGQISPVVDFRHALSYAHACLDLLLPAINVLKKSVKPLLVGNPEIIKKMKQYVPFEAGSLSHKDYMIKLKRSVGLVVPTSITSIFEAGYNKVPLLFLPEQHIGHCHNFRKLVETREKTEFNKNVFFGALLSHHFPELLSNEEKESDKIYDLLNRVRKNKNRGFMQENKELFIRKLEEFSYDAESKLIADLQQEALGLACGRYEEGTNVIIKELFKGG
jgi:hypothetical protein